MARWHFRAGIGLLLCGLAGSGAAHGQQAPFTIGAPAASSRAFSLESGVVHARANPIASGMDGSAQAPRSLLDSVTGTKIEEFGLAYNYANPLHGTVRHYGDGVGPPGGGPVQVTASFVVARFGSPPRRLPPIRDAGLSSYSALTRYAIVADAGTFPDAASARILDAVAGNLSRTGITEIDITMPHADPRRDLLRLVALDLVGHGVHPAAILDDRAPVLPGGGADRAPLPDHLVRLRVMDR